MEETILNSLARFLTSDVAALAYSVLVNIALTVALVWFAKTTRADNRQAALDRIEADKAEIEKDKMVAEALKEIAIELSTLKVVVSQLSGPPASRRKANNA